MSTIIRDLKFGLKMLKKSPGFTLIAVLTIGLGIGANTTIFSIFNAFILRPLPYENADRLVSIREHGEKFGDMSTSYPNYLDWRKQNQAFEEVACIRDGEANMTGLGKPERINETWVSASLFSILGVQPVLGRSFSEEDDQPGERTIILSYSFWQQRFGGQEDALGKTVTLDFVPFTVIGVMPAGFNFPHFGFDRSDVWTPIGLRSGQDWLMERGNHPGIYSIGLLKPGISIEKAQSDMDRVTTALSGQYPESNTGLNTKLYDLKTLLNEEIESVLFALIQCVLFVLLIACANIANLLLARSTARQQEIAIRTAMGVSRLGLFRQFSFESLILSAMGAGIGIVFSVWGLSGVMYMLPDELLWAAKAMLTIDRVVLFYTLGLTLVTSFAFGLIPVLQSSKINLNEVLKDSGRSTSGGKQRINFRHWVTGAQVALALVLLVGSGLTVRSLVEVLNADLGYNPKNVLVMEMSLPYDQYKEDEKSITFFRTLLDELESVPGVENAAIGSPLLGGWQSTYQVEGEPVKPPGQKDSAEFKQVTPQYREAMGITLLNGRFFDERDTLDGVKVVIVDEKFANLHWPNENPIGKRIRQGAGEENANEWLEVIGLIRHIKYYGIEHEARQEVLIPLFQSVDRSVSVALRTSVDPVSVVNSARDTVFQVDADLPVSNVRTLEEIVTRQTLVKTLLTTFLGIFAGIALFLSAIGIYGVMSYSVTQRYHEFGIRMALGASMYNVIRMVVKQGFKLVLTGLAIGLVISVWVAYLLASQLYNVSIFDPITYIAVAAILIAVALLACFLPAWRASRVNPMNALRYE